MDRKENKSLMGLMICQFTGAFNDLAFRWMLVFLAIHGVSNASGNVMQEKMTLAILAFSLPMIFVCLPAAYIADKFSKRTLIVTMKFSEIIFMAAATFFLFHNPNGGAWGFVILGLMGLQSGVFSPAKYGIIPEVLPHRQLTKTNALIELLTMLAIISGSAVGGWLKGDAEGTAWKGALFLTVCAIVGFIASLRVPKVPAARAEANSDFMAAFKESCYAMKSNKVLRLTILGLSFFYTIASLLIQNVSVFAKNNLGLSDSLSSLPMAACGIGIVLGCLLAAKFSNNRVEMGIIPLGAIGLALFSCIFGFFDLASYSQRTSMFIIDGLMLLIGVASGLLIVPLQSLLQWQSPKECRGAVIALSNIFIITGTLIGSLIGTTLANKGVTTEGIFVTIALMTLAGMIWALKLLPQALFRCFLLILTHSIYTIKCNRPNNVPETGGALLVPNHVTLTDGLYILATVDRPVRFLVDSGFFHYPLLRPIMKLLGAVPISSSGGPRVVIRALQDAGKYLDQGEVVCIFAEGQITRTGMMQPFQRGMERLVKGKNIPIIPVHLDRVWGSIFSHQGGGYLSKLPDRIPYPVTVSYGSPLPAETPVSVVRKKIHDLGQEAWVLRKNDIKPLHVKFIQSSRKSPIFRRSHMLDLAFADGKIPRLNRIKSLTAALSLGHALIKNWEGQDHVGILLPPSVGSALTNIACSMSGKTSVNLNYSTGMTGLLSAAKQAGLSSVVSSREFLDALNIELPDTLNVIYIDEIMKNISKADKYKSLILALFASVKKMENHCGATRPVDVDDVATIIFSSGSTSEPKGVMLTHYNIASNCEAADQNFRAQHNDRLLGILPLFHSFGYMAMWYACHHGVGIVFHPNPVDAARIGELVQSYRITMLLATPTFLQLYLRRVTPAQFGSLRMVIAGAEKFPERMAQAFEDHFGIRPLEGYGSTECSPAIAMGTTDFRSAGFYQPGSRRGFVGQPLPGVSISIVDPDTFEDQGSDTEGMILVKGPNVMKGYLGKPTLTQKVIRNGWYVTGDIGLLDEDGFLKITGRLTRFSKIGGEMVPHGAIEDALHQAADLTEQTFAVTAVPDEKKGEKIVIVHNYTHEISDIIDTLKTMGLPNIFIPNPNNFIKVEALPLLGTGKLDLRGLKEMATTFYQQLTQT